MDERFCRMWEFYLIVSELSFIHGKHMVFQIQLTKDRDTLPITRDYMAKVEASLKSLDQLADEVIFFGLNNADAHHVAGLQRGFTRQENVAVNLRRIPR